MAPESSSFAIRDSALVMRGIPSYEDPWRRLSFVLGKPLRPPSHRKLNKTRKIGRTSTAEIDFFSVAFSCATRDERLQRATVDRDLRENAGHFATVG